MDNERITGPNINDETELAEQVWPTGIYASAAVKSALHALITNEFIDPVGIVLPDGAVPYFLLSMESMGEGYATAGISKEADENTSAITIIATVFPAPPATGIVFQAGEGVDTKDGEALISHEARIMMSAIATELCEQYELSADLLIMISAIKNGDEETDNTQDKITIG